MNDEPSAGSDPQIEKPEPTLTWEFVGPTAEDDIRRAIYRYGIAAVKAAAKELTKPKRGRPKIPDWTELSHVAEADARDWLDGRDPFSARTNYAIAKRFADERRGQSGVSTHARIVRKLKEKPYDRNWYMLHTAMVLSRDEYPHSLHLKALEAIAEIDGHPVWQSVARSARNAIADYEKKNGKAPASALTMSEIEGANRNALLSFDLPPLTGGLLPNMSKSSKETLGTKIAAFLKGEK